MAADRLHRSDPGPDPRAFRKGHDQQPGDDALANRDSAGGAFRAEKHMYEEIFHVRRDLLCWKGRGATVVWNEGTPKLIFEWDQDACFAIPLNASHEIHNGSGSEPVRLYAATNMPAPFNLYGSPEFVFNCPFTFNDRLDPFDDLFQPQATKLETSCCSRTSFPA
jgi:hypothetical protein